MVLLNLLELCRFSCELFEFPWTWFLLRSIYPCGSLLSLTGCCGVSYIKSPDDCVKPLLSCCCLDIVRPGCWTLDFGETLKLRLCLLSRDGMYAKFVPFRLERAPSAFSWVSERPASWKSRSSLFPLELFWAGLNGSFLLLIWGKLAAPVPAVDLLYLFKSDRLIILVPFVKESSSWLSL